MQLSESIKALREKTLLSQEGLSTELGVAVSTVNRWETGKARPNISAMKSIKAFCLSHGYPYEEVEKGWLIHSSEHHTVPGKGIPDNHTNGNNKKNQGDNNE